MAVLISRCLLDLIVAEAANDPAHEVCGLLLGDVDRVVDIRSTANIAARLTNSFEVDPHILFEAMRAERAGGPRLIGHYHSHPAGVAEPSARDADAADDLGRLWLIVAGEEAALWRAVAGGSHLGRFERVELTVTD